MDYVASGGVSLCGIGAIEYTIFYYTTYSPGDIVYNKKKAIKGKTEKICIKKVTLNTIDACYAGSGIYPKYTDKYNSIWFDNDLVDAETAANLIESYLNKIGTEYFEIVCNL